MKIPRALTIAGSDSGGGAGIQADLKTFSAFGVYGMTAITALTAQNTIEVKDIYPVSPKFLELQIDAIMEDIGVDAAKTGMLYSSILVETAAKKVREYRIRTIVDPVMVAKSGKRLLDKDAIETMKRKLIPEALILTPNIPEAEILLGYRIKDLEKAAEDLSEMGVEAVVIKGGHLKNGEVIDLLYYKGKSYIFKKERIKTRNTHGTGCAFSAAITALIAKGKSILEAVGEASEFMERAIKFSLPIGRGYGPVNPMIDLYHKAEKYIAWKNVSKALEIIEDSPELIPLIPEVRMNIGEATTYAETVNDICAVEGRISIVNGRLRGAGCPKFGASKHVARIILAAMKMNRRMKAAMNIKYDDKIILACRELGLKIAQFRRGEEPLEIKQVEGGTLKWGIEKAFKEAGETPDIIFDKGEKGKEPMIRILGEDALKVVLKAKKIGKKILKDLSA
ncbi:MAG: bifunctional hydroxymethylpyrimidine kinase/phosphomethylpyrimidine kinase [Candidatus Verstraetearchaeota archaeon]|nr:bifunctional hydroxymethylpyrimidine kinase/phosphomethylpyrimidine kinase [Candidatus Verstraetearchaeota archaeon]